MDNILNIAHDLLNKYTVLAFYIRMAKEDAQLVPFGKIESVSQRIGELINDLCESAKQSDKIQAENREISFYDFKDLLKTYISKLCALYPESHIYLTDSELKTEARISINPKLLYQVLDNLAENSDNAGKKMICFKLDLSHSEILLSIQDGDKTQSKQLERSLVLPRGIGSQIITTNLKSMKATIVKIEELNDNFRIEIKFPILQAP